MQTLICLVRHGVTDWNYDGRAQGRTDIPLNGEGLRQADAVAARLASEPWDYIYSSTLSRAHQTAEAIARATGHEVVPDPQLVERDMGVMEGATYWERIVRWPDKGLLELPGVESDEVMADRATKALAAIAERHAGKRVICVAHGGLIQAFLDTLPLAPGTEDGAGAPGNTSVARILYENGRFITIAQPDNRHLQVDGIEFTGEKGRVQFGGLSDLAAISGLPMEVLSDAIRGASAVEGAWLGGKLVAFARAFSDGVLSCYVDLLFARHGSDHLLPVLLDRLEARFPGVAVMRVERETEQRAGD